MKYMLKKYVQYDNNKYSFNLDLKVKDMPSFYRK